MNILKNKYLYHLLIFIGYALIAFIILFSVLQNDTSGSIYDWNIPLLDLQKVIDGLFSSWNPENNGMVQTFRTFFFFDLVLAGLGSIGISVTIVYKLVILCLFALMSTGMFLLMRSWKLPLVVSFLAGFFYMSSVFILIRLASGYFGYLISAAFFPLLIACYFRAIALPYFFNRYLILACICSLFVFAQIHFIVYFVCFFAADIVVSLIFGQGKNKRKLATIGAIIIFFILANIFWILPSFFAVAPVKDGLNAMVFASRIDSLPHSFWNTLLLSDHANTEETMLAVNSLGWRTFPLFAFIAGIFMLGYKNIAQRKEYALGICLSVFPLILSVGASAPFAQIYPKLFSSLPGISIFREPYHLQYLILLGYTIVFALAMELILKNKIFKKQFNRVICYLLLTFSVVFFNLPSFSGNLYGYIGSINLPKGLDSVNQAIFKASEERIFYPPSLNFWKAKDDNRIGVNYPDSFGLSFRNEFVNEASSDLDGKNYSWKLRNAAANAFVTKNAALPDLLAYLGAGSIVDRKFLESYYFASVDIGNRRLALRHLWMNETSEDKLKNWDFEKVQLTNQVDLYKLPVPKEHIYLSTSPTKICNFSEISGNIDSFIFSPDGQVSPYLTDGCKNTIEESLLSSEEKFDFSSVSLKHTADLGWSPGFLSFYESMSFSNTISDFIFTRIPDQFSFDLTSADPLASIYVKYYSSPRSGTISINGMIIDTKGTVDDWIYKEIPKSVLNHYEIKSLNGENAIGGVGFISGPNKHSQVSKLADSKISWSKVNSSEYKLLIQDQTLDPKLVIFAENYDPRWTLKIAGKNLKPFIINSYANGFLIPGDYSGEGELVFSGQRTYIYLLYFSIGIVLLGIITLFINRKRKN